MANSWDEAGQALRNSRLYVDPDAERDLEEAGIPFPADEQDDARELLDDAATPIWVAVLPAAAGDHGQAQDLARSQGHGTYLVVYTNPESGSAGGSAFSFEFGNIESIATQAMSASSDMYEFVEAATARLNSLAESSGGNGTGSGTSAPSGGGGLLPLAILAAAGAGGFLLYRRNRRGRERAELAQVRDALEEDVTVYGERLSALDLDVRADSKVPIEARREYERALDLYENAKVFADRAEKPTDLRAVTNALEEGRWLLGCVDARLNGTPLPDRRAPCFFDPSHGPSVEDVEWAPPGGVQRAVPACAADAQRLKQGLDPDVRLVPTADGERRPYWDAGPAYGAWAAGYYGAVLPAMMVGTMLGTSMAAPMAYGAAGDAGGGDFGGGFGDDGGGDFGGGFDGGGGGDFGGGFGGGDFGGF